MDQKILREYLVSLGFKVDGASQVKFTTLLGGMDKRLLKVGGTIAGLTAGAAAMTTAFAKQMEAMYYSSRLANSTVGNLRSAGFGAEKIGLSSERITGAITDMARALRGNPGLQGVLEGLGIQVTGRDMSDVMRDMVAQLRKLPFYVGSQFAGLFGMDPDTFLLMSEGLEKYDTAKKESAELDKRAGYDADAAAKASVEYANAITTLTRRLDILKSTMAVGLLPVFKDVVSWLDKALTSLNALFQGRWRPGPELQKDLDALNKLSSGDWKGALKIWADARAAQEASKPIPAGNSKAGAGRGFVNPPQAGSPQALFAGLEEQYGLPRGLLDRMWAKESSRGQNMLGPVTRSGERARGHFQFMSAAAKDYGVTDPDDLANSATGAAKFMSAMGRKYGGDWEKALTAYNWGPGNLDKYGLGKAPAESRDYSKMARGLTINAPITIQGAQDPRATAQEVVSELNANIARNMGSSVQ